MAKKKKRKGKGNDGILDNAAWGALGGVVANILGQLVADGIEQYMAGGGGGGGGGGGKGKKGRKKKVGEEAGPDDPRHDGATVVLRALCAHGPRSVAELVTDTGLDLGDLLDVLITVREFGLVAVATDTDDARVSVTPAGSRVVTTAATEGIRQETARMLEE